MEELFAVLENNRADIEQIVNQIGVSNLVRIAPPILRIVKTIAAHKDDPVQAAEDAHLTLYYSEQTREKVREFQRKHNLKADGLIGDRTWAVIEKLTS